MANTRKASWLSAIALVSALALLAPWHIAGAGTLPGDAEHRAGCPLVADGAQPVLAQAPKAPSLDSGGVADCPRRAWSGLAPDSPSQAGIAALAPPASSRPIYLLSSRLRL